jgi:hypothetical protein
MNKTKDIMQRLPRNDYYDFFCSRQALTTAQEQLHICGEIA